MTTPTVGQILYSVPAGRTPEKREPEFVTVKSVGRKYFIVGPADNGDKYAQNQVELETWRQKSDYTPSFTLYESELAYTSQQEANRLRDVFRLAFDGYGNTSIPLADLRQIADILHIPHL